MNKKARNIPRVGVVTLAFPGYFLGEEKAPSKQEEMLSLLNRYDLDVVKADRIIMDTAGARKAGEDFSRKGVDFILAVLATFVPDHFIVGLLDACDAPIFLWAVEREIDPISLVGALLINPTLYDLEKQYQLFAGDISDRELLDKLLMFGRAAMMRRILKNMRVGYMGANPDIMFSMAVDEYGLKKVFGITVVPIRDFEFSGQLSQVSGEEAKRDWNLVKEQVGSVEVSDKDGLDSSQAFLSMVKLAQEYRLDAFSINCWPHLKAKICLPVARINDKGIGAGCEGDLHSTILMRLLYILSGRAAIDGDFMRLFPEENQILFSHCGAGSFSMASSKESITLHESIETHDGIAVFFPVNEPGTVTALNLMGSRAGYRVSALVGEVVETDMVYEGNPMRVEFHKPVKDILQAAVKNGAGHHWCIAYGDFSREFKLLSSFLNIEFHLLS
jgi:L-fucose isomerase-like protein